MNSLSALIAGAACGLLYASTLIAILCLAFFDLYKKKDPRIKTIFDGNKPSKIVFSLIAILKPSLAILGIAFAYLLYIIEPESSTGTFMNVPLIYFLAILSMGLLIQAIQSVLFPLAKVYALSNATLFISIYGLLLPVLIL